MKLNNHSSSIEDIEKNFSDRSKHLSSIFALYKSNKIDQHQKKLLAWACILYLYSNIQGFIEYAIWLVANEISDLKVSINELNRDLFMQIERVNQREFEKFIREYLFDNSHILTTDKVKLFKKNNNGNFILWDNDSTNSLNINQIKIILKALWSYIIDENFFLTYKINNIQKSIILNKRFWTKDPNYNKSNKDYFTKIFDDLTNLRHYIAHGWNFDIEIDVRFWKIIGRQDLIDYIDPNKIVELYLDILKNEIFDTGLVLHFKDSLVKYLQNNEYKKVI